MNRVKSIAPWQRNITNAVMTERIRQIHLDSYESYGMPRGVPSSWNKANASAASVWRSSCAKPVSRASASAEASATVTTRRDKLHAPASNLVNRRFHATGPNQLWVAT